MFEVRHSIKTKAYFLHWMFVAKPPICISTNRAYCSSVRPACSTNALSKTTDDLRPMTCIYSMISRTCRVSIIIGFTKRAHDWISHSVELSRDVAPQAVPAEPVLARLYFGKEVSREGLQANVTFKDVRCVVHETFALRQYTQVFFVKTLLCLQCQFII